MPESQRKDAKTQRSPFKKLALRLAPFARVRLRPDTIYSIRSG